MLIKSKCEHCQGEFEDEGFEKTVFCPSCGKETHIRPVGSSFGPIRSVETADYDGVIMAGYFLAVLLPLFGFFVGVYLLVKSQHGHGVAAMALSVFSIIIWTLIFSHFR
jgi:hypothetical protein